MSAAVSVILTLAFIVVVAYMVVKKYNSVLVFLGSSMVVLMVYAGVTGVSILGDSGSGNAVLDVFTYVTNQFKSNTSSTGMILMMVTGYATYMNHIGASTKLAYLATRPLTKMKNPYTILSGLLVIGCLLKLVVTSHVGLVTLLMSVTFPIMTSLGISPLSAASVVIFSGFCDWGPNDSSAVFAAENVAGMPMMEYFVTYQGRLAAIVILIAAVTLPMYLRFMDKKDMERSGKATEITALEDAACPLYYAVFPIIPLVLVVMGAFVPSMKVDVATANIMALSLVFAVELIRGKDKKAVTNDMSVVMKAMGGAFASVVSILIAAAVFAAAIKLLDGINIISNFLASAGSGAIVAIILMSLITFGAAMLLGSGNASWYAFGPLVPDMTSQMGISAATIAVPMQFGTGIGRCISPVAGAMIAASGMAGVELTDLIKRNVVPAFFLFACNIIVSMIIV